MKPGAAMAVGPQGRVAEGEEDATVKKTSKSWLLVALIVGVIATGYIWTNGVPGTAQPLVSLAKTKSLLLQDQPPVPAPSPGQRKVVLEDLGMACPLCRAAVAFQLGRTPGIISYNVDLGNDSAAVLYDPAKVAVADLEQAIADAGYKVRGVREALE
jgi:copper chaperone